MSDNIPVTPGTGKIVAAEETGGRLFQIIKIAIGAAGTAVLLAFGQANKANSLPVVLASDQDTLSVDQKTSAFGDSASFTRAANTTAYSAGDLVGQVQQFAVLGAAGNAIMITGGRLEIDIAALPSGMTGFRLHLFNAAPSTTQVDNDAFNLIAADRAKYVGYLDFGTPSDLGDTLFAEINGVNKQLKLAAGSTGLSGVLTTIGGYQAAANSDGPYKVTLHSVAV